MTYLDELAARIRDEVPPSLVPARSESLFRFYAVLLRAKGVDVRAEDIHDAWVAWMSDAGRDHPSMVEFDRLDTTVKTEDEPFVAAIRRIAARRNIR
jgi:hypothetical protein